MQNRLLVKPLICYLVILAIVFTSSFFTTSFFTTSFFTTSFAQEKRVELESSDSIHIIPYGEHPSQIGQLFIPETNAESYPVVVLIHGGCWHVNFGLELIQKFAKSIAAEGIAVWSIEFRRLGEYGGWPNTYLDVAEATDYLRVLAKDYPIDLDNVISVGHSSGGHLALWLGGRKNISSDSDIAADNPLELQGVVSLAGIADLARATQQKVCVDAARNMIGGPPESFPDRYKAASPEELLPFDIPQVIIHGELDLVVPINYVRPYVVKAKKLGDSIRFIQLVSTKHFEMIIKDSPQWQKTIEEIKRLLGQ